MSDEDFVPHQEFASRTAWSLFNAFTEVQKGAPTVFCNTPYHVVRVEVTVHCAGCDSTRSFLRCGSSSNSVQFSACGHTHTVSLPFDGNIWEDALADCSVMFYSAP